MAPEVVDEMEIAEIERMGTYLHFHALQENWRYEDNQDLYIGVARKFRKDEGRKCEDPDDEEENVLLEAKKLSLKDANKRKPGERQARASDAAPNDPPISKAFRKK